MESINTKAIKDAVAIKNGYRDWNHFLDVLSCGEPIEEAQESVFNEVISEVAKQVAERQREMCNKKAKIKIVAHYEKLPKGTKSMPFTSKLGSSWKCYIAQKSILNAPIPEIK
jgi:hypothetical protein